eukprot:SAG31_NODE_1976_length_6750_cov_8.060893_2_plen_84_part_00
MPSIQDAAQQVAERRHSGRCAALRHDRRRPKSIEAHRPHSIPPNSAIRPPSRRADPRRAARMPRISDTKLTKFSSTQFKFEIL